MSNIDRPYIICHMMSTIEGKIASGTEGVDILSDFLELYTRTEDMLNANALMCGRVTMQMFASGVGSPLPPPTVTLSDSDFLPSSPYSAVVFAVDTKGMLRWNTNTITLSNIPEAVTLVVIVTQKTPKAYIQYLHKKNISYLFAGDDVINFELLFKKIKEVFNIKTLVLEGGGLLNGSVMAADFIDEISLILTPLIINKSDAPSVFERNTSDIDVKRYHLSQVKQMEHDAVWLRYKKVNN